MKKFFRVVGIVIVLVALWGGMVLVKRNQETRRGATSAETSGQVLPSEITAEAGKNFNLTVWVNSGKDTDKISGAEIELSYDPAKLKYIESTGLNGYTILNSEVTVPDKKLQFKMVTLGEEKGGAVDLVKITFQSLGGDSQVLFNKASKVMVSGQNTTWDIAQGSGSRVLSGGGPSVTPVAVKYAKEGETCGGLAAILCEPGLRCDTGSRVGIPEQTGKCVRDAQSGTVCTWCGLSCVVQKPGMQCPMVAVPSDKQCAYVGGECTITGSKPTVTPTLKAGGCGQRCTSDSVCGLGMICAPIWWQCNNLPADLLAKIQSNQPLTAAESSQMISICPKAAETVMSGRTSTSGSVTMPTFYGVCRNQACVASANCSCTSGPTPTRVPTLSQNQGRLGMELRAVTSGTDQARVGDKVHLGVWAEVDGNNKISAVSTKIKYDPTLFSIDDIQWEGRGTIVKKEIDSGAGTIVLYYTWNLPSGSLFNRYTVATVKMTALKEGRGQMTFVSGFNHEISGLNAAGQSGAYTVTTSASNSVTILAKSGQCGVCSGTADRKKGDANCDGQVNSVDFEIWRSEMFDKGGLSGTVSSTWQSDFNCDQKVSGVDFEIWRQTVFN